MIARKTAPGLKLTMELLPKDTSAQLFAESYVMPVKPEKRGGRTIMTNASNRQESLPGAFAGEASV